jgi:putative FmdB family regulatory protein
MPIYAYRCTSCGFEKDVMQKISDARLTHCPACNTENFAKQVTAAGFQLKGTGWYATDFKGGGAKAATTKVDTGAQAKPDSTTEKPAGTKSDGVSPAPTDAVSTTTPAPTSPAPAAATSAN